MGPEVHSFRDLKVYVTQFCTLPYSKRFLCPSARIYTVNYNVYRSGRSWIREKGQNSLVVWGHTHPQEVRVDCRALFGGLFDISIVSMRPIHWAVSARELGSMENIRERLPEIHVQYKLSEEITGYPDST
jgi:hypothetical protein